jgi:hypothetical protein
MRDYVRMWGLQPGVAPQKVAVPHAAGTTQLVVFTRNEHSVDVDEPPAGFSQGDESTVSAGMWNAAGQRVGRLDAAGTLTAVFQQAQTARGQFTFTATVRGSQITATGILIGSDTVHGFDARHRQCKFRARRARSCPVPQQLRGSPTSSAVTRPLHAPPKGAGAWGAL